MTDWEDLVLVGEIGPPNGMLGQVFVRPVTYYPELRFCGGATFWAGGPGREPRLLTVADARWHGGRLVLRFEGLTSLEQVEALGRVQLRVEADRLLPLPDGQFYHHDLVGCAVVTVSGEQVGTVTRVEDAGSSSLTVGTSSGELLVPLAETICVAIDVKARRITIAPPEGLLEVNRTTTGRRRGMASQDAGR
ncbi:MAG: ribosome maturation factor RimM [Vicinamibacterales bacterium]